MSLNYTHNALAYVVTFLCLKAEILRHLYRIICTFLTKEACCRNTKLHYIQRLWVIHNVLWCDAYSTYYILYTYTSFDVVSLCSSIPHDFGLCAHKDFLLDCSLPAIVVKGIHNMTALVIRKNVFEFNSEGFLQTSGTAIGTKMATAFANNAISIYERKLLTGKCNKPFVWFRYIDDIFAIWTCGEDKFKDFMPYINSINSSFQLTRNYSKECVQFWDVSVFADNSGNITTDLYIKPTDTHQYLLATICHPNHTNRSIPYCQALRILRICSNKESAKLRCTELVDCLDKRGYNKRNSNKQIERALTNFINPPMGRQGHTTRPVYFNV